MVREEQREASQHVIPIIALYVARGQFAPVNLRSTARHTLAQHHLRLPNAAAHYARSYFHSISDRIPSAPLVCQDKTHDSIHNRHETADQSGARKPSTSDHRGIVIFGSMTNAPPPHSYQDDLGIINPYRAHGFHVRDCVHRFRRLPDGVLRHVHSHTD